MYARIAPENLKERGNLGDVSIDGKMILKWILKKWGTKRWGEFKRQ
jgi:hypothetical protein